MSTSKTIPVAAVACLVAAVLLIVATGVMVIHMRSDQQLDVCIKCFFTGRRPMPVCVGNLRQLRGAAQQYLVESTVSNAVVTNAAQLVPVYLRREPYCPRGGGQPYIYSNNFPLCPVQTQYPEHKL